MVDFELRAIFTELNDGYVISVSKLADDGEITIVGEQDVSSLKLAHDFLEHIADELSVPVQQVSKLYNIDGEISTEPPNGRT